jgi:hypothetical protein
MLGEVELGVLVAVFAGDKSVFLECNLKRLDFLDKAAGSGSAPPRVFCFFLWLTRSTIHQRQVSGRA